MLIMELSFSWRADRSDLWLILPAGLISRMRTSVLLPQPYEFTEKIFEKTTLFHLIKSIALYHLVLSLFSLLTSLICINHFSFLQLCLGFLPSFFPSSALFFPAQAAQNESASRRDASVCPPGLPQRKSIRDTNINTDFFEKSNFINLM